MLSTHQCTIVLFISTIFQCEWIKPLVQIILLLFQGNLTSGLLKVNVFLLVLFREVYLVFTIFSTKYIVYVKLTILCLMVTITFLV